MKKQNISCQAKKEKGKTNRRITERQVDRQADR